MFCICLYKSICTPLYPWSNFLKSISPKFNCWYTLASLVAQLVKNPPIMQKTSIWSLGWEDPLEKGIHYPLQYSWASLVAQMVKNLPAKQETWVQSLGWEEGKLLSCLGEGKRYPLQYSCPKNSTDRERSLEGYSPRGRKKLDTTEWLSLAHTVKLP